MRREGIPKKDIEKCTRVGGGGQLKFAKGEGMLRSSHQSPALFQGPVNGK